MTQITHYFSLSSIAVPAWAYEGLPCERDVSQASLVIHRGARQHSWKVTPRFQGVALLFAVPAFHRLVASMMGSKWMRRAIVVVASKPNKPLFLSNQKKKMIRKHYNE